MCARKVGTTTGAAALLLILATDACAEGVLPGSIEGFLARWKAAVEARDLDRVMALYAPDFLQGGMDRAYHRALYRREFARLEARGGTLTVVPEIRLVRVRSLQTREGPVRLADIEGMIKRQVRWGGRVQAAERRFWVTRLREVSGVWRLCGDGSRALPRVAVVVGDGRTRLLLAAVSPDPRFPLETLVRARGLGEVTLREFFEDEDGLPGVRRRLWVRTPPPVGHVFGFLTRYPDGVERLEVRVRGVVKAVPEILSPGRDFDIERWPVRVTWKDVSAEVRDFSHYEVHVRRADTRAEVLRFRFVPAARCELRLGETEAQRRALSGAAAAYLLEVRACDAYGNFAFSRRRVYGLVAGREAPVP